jgi:hypothetical protein
VLRRQGQTDTVYHSPDVIIFGADASVRGEAIKGNCILAAETL